MNEKTFTSYLETIHKTTMQKIDTILQDQMREITTVAEHHLNSRTKEQESLQSLLDDLTEQIDEIRDSVSKASRSAQMGYGKIEEGNSHLYDCIDDLEEANTHIGSIELNIREMEQKPIGEAA